MRQRQQQRQQQPCCMDGLLLLPLDDAVMQRQQRRQRLHELPSVQQLLQPLTTMTMTRRSDAAADALLAVPRRRVR